MLSTLTKLGEQLSQNQNEWADIIDIPKIDSKKENLVAKLIFNIDEQSVDTEISGEYMESSPFTHKNIKIKDRRGKYTYACCELPRISKIEYTFFGRTDTKGNQPSRGEFKERIDKQYPELKTTEIYKIFDTLFNLHSKFLQEKWNAQETINEKLLGSDHKKTSKTKIALIYACIISKELGYYQPKPIYEIPGFDSYIKLDRFTKSVSFDEKISYATGLRKENVIGVEFSNRHSLNYMFVKETLNYASQFKEKNFSKNYQLNSGEQLYLERASKYLLENRRVSIANINHCIIPQFLNNTKVDYEVVLEKVFKKSDLLFQSRMFSDTLTSISDELDKSEIYWINFLAFESDGNSFKTINIIKDVSITHFETVIQTLKVIDGRFKKMEYAVDWENVMSELKNKEKKIQDLNFYTFYQIIPQRRDKERKNDALHIFKSILENRQIDKQVLFKHFVDLVLCHYYHRYEGYKNVKKFGDDFFDFAIRDSVFKYLAFLKFLIKLNLISNMENTNENQVTVEIESFDQSVNKLLDYQQKIDNFFNQMNFISYQKALFYLGRMLSSVAYIQKDKKRTVLDKLNFNGMDKTDILRLRNALIEKAKQYDEVDKVIFNDARFNENFNFNNGLEENNKTVNPSEALFFILTGYSFGIKAKETKK
jgi:CRISPR-associated protein Csh1